jgi:hypothetical protein
MKTYILIFFLFTRLCFAQTLPIKIIAQDQRNNLISNATIQFKNIDFEVLKFGFTNKSGQFNTTLNKNLGKVLIRTSSIGFKPDTTYLDLAIYNSEVINIVLTDDVKQLQEIYVKPKFNIGQDNDTTTYKVSDFTTSDNRNLEDVIKKMPGMQVSDDGTISFKGKKISKILLDGDDVTGDKYKLLSKNITPQQVTDIQAIEHYIEDALLKGIINSDDVVLNLKVKNPKALIGSLDLAYGTNNRKDLSANLISYLKKTKSFIYGNTNNLGRLKSQDFSFDLDREKLPAANPLFSKDIFLISPFSTNNLALNNSDAASLNFVNTVNKKLKIKGNINYFNEKQNAISNLNVQYFEPNNIVTQDINNENKLAKNLEAEVNLDYLINSKSRILSSVKFHNQPQNYQSKSLSIFNNVSQDSVFQQFNTAYKYLFSDIKYTLKLSNNSALLVSSKYLNQDIDLGYLPTSGIYVANPIFNGSNQLKQDVNQNYSIYNFNINGLKRKGASFFNVNSGFNSVNTGLNTNLFYLNNQSFERLGNSFENNETYINNKFYFNGSYILAKEHYKLKLEANNSYQQFKTAQNDTTFFVFEPKLTFNYKINQTNSLNFSYNYKNTPIDAFNYYQNNVLNSFRSLFNGINQFYNFGASNFSINYSYNDFTDKYLSFNIQSNYIFSKQGFIYENFFENNFYITRQLFFDGFKNYGLNFNVKKFVPSVSTSFSANYGLNSRDYFNKVGSQINEYTGTSQTLSLKGDTGFDFPLNFNLGFQYFKNATNENKQTIAFNNSFKYSLITRIKLSEIILPLINFEWARVNQQDYRMLNADIQINPKKGKFKYSVEGKNLLNLKSFDNFFIDNAQSARFSNQILGRYIAARVQFSIN